MTTASPGPCVLPRQEGSSSLRRELQAQPAAARAPPSWGSDPEWTSPSHSTIHASRTLGPSKQRVKEPQNMNLQGGEPRQTWLHDAELPQPLSFSGRASTRCSPRPSRVRAGGHSLRAGAQRPVHRTETSGSSRKPQQRNEGKGQAQTGSQENPSRTMWDQCSIHRSRAQKGRGASNSAYEASSILRPIAGKDRTKENHRPASVMSTHTKLIKYSQTKSKTTLRK